MIAVKGLDSKEERIEHMVTLYQLPLLRMCIMYLYDEELAKDAVQETFINAYRNLDKFRAESSEKSRGIQVIYTAVSEALTTKIKVAVVTGFVIASPVIIWQIWRFIKPALYPKERRSFRLFFFFALLLFLVGIVFCYASVYFLAIDFFMVSGEGLATPMLSMDKYVSFLFGFLLPFGVAFMLPVFVYITTRIGLTTPQMLAAKRKYVILAIFILAAILTPPDVVSQVMLGVPMIALYEVGILVSKLVKKNGAELR